MIGFARVGLFKRLESSGNAFLLSIKRYIVRNAVYLSALEQNGEFPIGDIFSSLVDEAVEEDEPDIFAVEWDAQDGLERFLEAGRNIYARLSSSTGDARKKFQWIETGLFEHSLADDLLADCRALLKILEMAPHWDAGADRKLDALARLCRQTHPTEKLLIFTQFKDTADYLYQQLEKRGVGPIAEAFGGMDDISACVNRFSPVSNNMQAGMLDELRVLITTDTLSEGQNLQDAHIVVNFDLPWAIIRLVQRAGRVDRIGQKAREILCYCFLPEDGIEDIINLRARLQNRIQESADLIGSDEIFFEGDTINLRQVYEETLTLEEQEDETDLISRAYDIWRQAVKDDPALEKEVRRLPDVVYSAKRANHEQGALAYIKTDNNQHILAQLNATGEVVSQSQSKILDMLACSPNEPLAQPADNHHQLVEAAVRHVKEGRADLGGQLGGTNSPRHRVYSKLKLYLEQQSGTVFDSADLKRAVDQIYYHPLKETARDRLGRQLRAGITDDELADRVKGLYADNDLCAIPNANQSAEPHIICSMGLVK